MRDVVNFAGNDYLGLARHPEMIEALHQAALTYGISSTSSRWALGWTDLHEALENDLADFMGAEAACITGAAYFGGPIYFGRMAARGFRVVFADRIVHSNQFLGMRAAGLEIRTFNHLDAADLRRQLAAHSGPPPIVATDGVYGISGEVAPLAEIVAAAATVNAEVFVDDAHGIGAIGATGRGSLELAGISPNNVAQPPPAVPPNNVAQPPPAVPRPLNAGDIGPRAGRSTPEAGVPQSNRVVVLGSMSKAMGANGGFLAGRKELVELFRRSPEASGSAFPPAPIAAAARTALRLIRTQPDLLAKAHAHAAHMRRILAENGIAVVDDRHPIVAMLLADEFEAAALDKHFLSLGLRIPYFKYASEPRENLLRAAARAIYTEEHLARFAEAVRTRPRK